MGPTTSVCASLFSGLLWLCLGLGCLSRTGHERAQTLRFCHDLGLRGSPVTLTGFAISTRERVGFGGSTLVGVRISELRLASGVQIPFQEMSASGRGFSLGEGYVQVSGILSCVFPHRNGFQSWLYRSSANWPRLRIRKPQWTILKWQKRDPNRSALRALVRATWHGDVSSFSERFVAWHRSSGLSHSLAVSGQHVSILALLFFLVFQGFTLGVRRWSDRRSLRISTWIGRARFFIPLCAATLLLWATGGSSPVFRAFVLVAIQFIFRATGWKCSAVQWICSGTAILLIWDAKNFLSTSQFLSVFCGALFAFLSTAFSDFRQLFFFHAGLSLAMSVLILPISVYWFGVAPITAMAHCVLFPLLWDFCWIPLGFLGPVLLSLGLGESTIDPLWNLYVDKIEKLPQEPMLFLPSLGLIELVMIEFAGICLLVCCVNWLSAQSTVSRSEIEPQRCGENLGK